MILFTVGVTEHWNRLPKEAVESTSMEIFKTELAGCLCNLLLDSCFSRGVRFNDLSRSLLTPVILLSYTLFVC